MARDPMFALEDLIEMSVEGYQAFEDSGQNRGAQFRTYPEYLRILLWDAGYRLHPDSATLKGPTEEPRND